MYDVRQDTDSQETYGLRQAVVDFSDIPDITTLQNLADQQLSQEKDRLRFCKLPLMETLNPMLGVIG